MDRRLGEPLPHQLANPTQAHPIATAEAAFPPERLFGINPDFSGLSPTTGQIPTRYSPVRRSTPPSKLGSFPLDLHVLSLPPAFNLSHDQTLQFSSVDCCLRSAIQSEFESSFTSKKFDSRLCSIIFRLTSAHTNYFFLSILENLRSALWAASFVVRILPISSTVSINFFQFFLLKSITYVALKDHQTG
jgi:hypothetical protein